jgi:hypothetical protein
MQKRLDELQRTLAAIIDTATDDERAELREARPPAASPRSGQRSLLHGNAAAVLQVIAKAESEELGGTLPRGSGQNLREQLRTRLAATNPGL